MPTLTASTTAKASITTFDGTELIGMFGLANRPGGYSRALCTFLEPVLATCGAAIEARNAHEARREAAQPFEIPPPIDAINAALVDCIFYNPKN